MLIHLVYKFSGGQVVLWAQAFFDGHHLYVSTVRG